MDSRTLFYRSVIDQLEIDGCKEITRLSPSRFFVTDKNGVEYDFKIKYCLKPRCLGVTDIHYVGGWMSRNRIDVIITNGVALTSHIQRYLDENKIRVILGWNPGNRILERLT